MMTKKIFINAILLLLASFLPVNAYADELSGKKLFEERRCSRCHTIGKGIFVGPDLYGVSDRYSEQEIMDWITGPETIYQKLGRSPVNKGYPPMPNLNVSVEEASKITKFLIGNQIGKDDKTSGTIKGKVINKTVGGGVEGVDVYLRLFMGDRKMDEKLSISDKTGGFIFENLPWNRSYGIVIRSDGIEYETARMVFPSDKTVIDLDLPIFNAGNDDSNIVINVNHYVMDIEDEHIAVAEIYEFENAGDTIFTGLKQDQRDDFKGTIKLNVPKEAEDLAFREGISQENSVRKGEVVYDTASFSPGNKRLVLTYKLPLKLGRNQMKKTFYYDTRSAVVLVSGSEKVQISGMEEMKPISFGDQTYRRWFIRDIKPRENNITISYFNTHLQFKRVELYPVIIFALIILLFYLFSLRGKRKKTGI